MHQNIPFLYDLVPLRPKFETAQEKILEWLLHLHTESEKRAKSLSDAEAKAFLDTLKERLEKVCCKPKDIAKRGHEISDNLHENWDEMEIYNLGISPQGTDLGVRVRKFAKIVDQVFEDFYKDVSSPPTDLIHVTCTGYVSPSGAQTLCSSKDWGKASSVIHAYHMGCYASLPAIRIGIGSLYQKGKGATSDVVHTELCSLHTNPLSHASDQLVSQSLFADGHIKYSLSFSPRTGKPGLKILAIHDEIIPHSVDAMGWTMVNWGAEILLAKEVPVLIRNALKGYLERLASSANKSLSSLMRNSHFAIHPGGPKILDQIETLFSLEKEQLKHSRDVLYNYGNMSSATLPHIWKQILDQEKGPCSIISLAFGPGLTIFGSILEKEC